MDNNLITILVVEDELPLLRVIKAKLENNNYEVVTARSVEQSIDFLNEIQNVNLIWLDHYLLGKKTGLDFVSTLKNDIKWKNIPIIVVTNTAGSDKLKTYLSLGVNKFYTKSNVTLQEIINDIKNFTE